MRYVGQRVHMEDAVAKVTGTARYAEDFTYPGLLYGKILFSPFAHAYIERIDTSKAEVLPGVHAVLCYKNTPDTVFSRMMKCLEDDLPRTERIFDRELRSVGDRVAAVAADSEEIARKALALIEVDYTELPVVLDAQQALLERAPKLYPEGNLLKEMLMQSGDVETALQQAEIVFENEVSTAAMHHGAIEPHQCVAYWSRQDELNIWGPQQAVCRAQAVLCTLFGLPLSKVHLHSPLIGGTFGGKDGITMEHVAALLSKQTGRYVRIRYSRKESMLATHTRHAMKLYTKMGVSREGILSAMDMRVFMDAGPYCGGSIYVQAAMSGKVFKLYRMPHMKIHSSSVYTNGLVAGAMRGFGSPKVFLAMELLVDKIAKALALDPVEIRLRNLVAPQENDPFQHSLGNARVQDCLREGARLFGWENRRSHCHESNTPRFAYGVGVAVGLHGNGVAPHAPDITCMNLSLNEDGTVMLRTGMTDHGAGTYTLLKQIVAEILQCSLDSVALVSSDTQYAPYDKGSGSSRNTWVGGSATIQIANQLKECMLGVAAQMLQLSPEEVELRQGVFFEKEGNRQVSKRQLAYYAYSKLKCKLCVTQSYNETMNAGSYGAHFAAVRVDKISGQIEVLEYLAVCDVGKALNPLLLEGQVEGAIMMGLGMALFEGFELNEKGQVKNSSFRSYRMAKAQDVPNVRIHFIEEGEEGGPYGAKSIGEAAIVPVAPAIVNAVNHALDTQLDTLPLTPARVLEALQKAVSDGATEGVR